jgi:methionyl aminopeptidase
MDNLFHNINNKHNNYIIRMLYGINPLCDCIDTINTINTEPDTIIHSLQKAGNIHKQVRQHLYSSNILIPGTSLVTIANEIETKTRELTLSRGYTSIYGGIGFPVGLSINECAAHFHPLKTDTCVLQHPDIIKVDYGVEIDGWIIDSAFTVYFDESNEQYANLTKGVREATYTGIKNAAIDVDINEWAGSIKEVMESYDIHPITNLGGHNILKEIIHGGVFLPSVPTPNLQIPRFAEGVYAIETFGSTDQDYVYETGESTIYRINPSAPILPSPINLKMESSRKLYSKLRSTFKTLPFTDRFVECAKTHLEILTKNQYLYSYPPLCVRSGKTAQYEHTIYISGKGPTTVFSQDADY